MLVCTIYKSYKAAIWVISGSGDAGHRKQVIEGLRKGNLYSIHVIGGSDTDHIRYIIERQGEQPIVYYQRHAKNTSNVLKFMFL